MVSERVRQVRLKLLQVVDHLFTRTTNFHSGDVYRGPEDSPVQGGQPSGDSFSSTSYFFVSNYIAAHLPELTESALVLSYRDPLPPDTLRKKWLLPRELHLENMKAYGRNQCGGASKRTH